MGLASATRLSFALVAVPFLLVLWLYPAYTGRDRWIGAVMFGAGFLLGFTPAIVLFVVDPQAFVFGNLEYIRLNTQYYQATGQAEAMTLVGKIGYFAKLLVTQPGNLIAIVVLIFGSVPLLEPVRQRMWGTRSRSQVHDKASSLFRYAFAVLLLIFALIGAFAATPSQPQYFYVLFPLIVLASAYAFNAWPDRLQPRGLLFFAGAVIVTVLLALPFYAEGLAVVFSPDKWYPVKMHERSQAVAHLVQRGRVLTLAPIQPLEGDASIYPEFATGPFGWRVAPLVTEAEREQFHLVAPVDLDAFLADDPPRGILVGLDNDDTNEELPFVAYARQNAFVPVKLPDEGTLWLSPLAVWQDSIVLGGYSAPEARLQPGDTLDLTLHLQNRRPIENNLNVLVRLVGADGEELARNEGWPWGSPTSSWPLDEVWPDGHQLTIPETAEPGYYALEVSFYDPADLGAFGQPVVIGHLSVGDDETDLEMADPLARFGSAIALIEAELPTGPLQPGDQAPVYLIWRAEDRPDTNYTFFLHLLDMEGNLAAQVDSPPLGGFFPTSNWLTGLPVSDELSLMLPDDLPIGRYQVVLGVYDPTDLQRLPVTVGLAVGSTANEMSVLNDAITLGTIDVE